MQRLTYIDSNGDRQVIGYSTDEKDTAIDNMAWVSRTKKFEQLAVWGKVDLRDRIPSTSEDYENGTKEILLEDNIGGEWEVVQRFYPPTGGMSKQDAETKVTLVGFGWATGEEKVELDLNNTNNVEVMEQALPDGYTLVAPDEGEVEGGYIEIDRYPIKDKRRRVYADMQQPDWVLIFTAEQDGNGNYEVYYQPRNFGGAVDELNGDTEPIDFTQWEKDSEDTIINKVEVDYVDEEGNMEDLEVVDQDSINKYVERFKPIKIPYGITQEQAQEIGENALSPDPNDRGVVKAPIYPTHVLNRNFVLSYSVESIDEETHYVRQQVNFYPEGRTKLEFEFVTDEAIDRAEDREEIRRTRRRLFATEERDFGNQDFKDANTEEVDDRYDDQKDNEQSHNVGGEDTTRSGGSSLVEESDFTSSTTVENTNEWQTNEVDWTVSNDGAGMLVFVSFNTRPIADPDDFNQLACVALARIWDGSNFKPSSDGKGSDAFHFAQSDSVFHNQNSTLVFWYPEEVRDGDSFELDIRVNEFDSVDEYEMGVRLHYSVIGEHQHDVGFATDRALDRETGVENEVSDIRQELEVLGETVEKLVEVVGLNEKDR